MPPMYYVSEADLHTRYWQIVRELKKEIGDGHTIEHIPNKTTIQEWTLFYQDLMINDSHRVFFLAEMRDDTGQEEFVAKVIALEDGSWHQHPLERGQTVRVVVNKLKAKGLIEMKDRSDSQ